MCYTSPTRRARIVALRKKGETYREIGEELHLNPSTALRLFKKYGPTEDFYAETPKSGRPHKLSEADVRLAARMIVKGEASTATKVQEQQFPNIHPSTMHRALHRYGFKAYKKPSKPLLSELHAEKRRAWAADYGKWDVEAWNGVLFSDESKFNLVGSDGQQWCWRTPGDKLNARSVSKKVKHGGGSVMVWGVITPNGVGRLHRIDGIMDTDVYIQILNESLLGTLKDYHIKRKDIYFQQDNDPKHTSKKATEWFRTKKIDKLDWPPNTPDMNIIEHVWDYLDKMVRTRNPRPRNRDELWLALLDEWNKIDFQYIRNLYESMPVRVEALKAAKGWYTKY